ncbi:MAG: helix-turn-helix domain-containing protein [Actinomycetota bacterium]|nr:helix-turn-helix domain-containing protein [Actinomycetota bacterium]
MDPVGGDVRAVAVLAEPQRARIFSYLASAPGSRTRHEVGEALGIGRTLVAFHLDKLQHAGLVEAAPAAPGTGRPGRPAQRYRVVQEEVGASVPPRRYALLAEILVQAAGEQALGERLQDAARRVATRRGRELAAAHCDAGPSRRSRSDTLDVVLTQAGYAPRDDGRRVVLTNCPFQRLRVLDTALVCSINAALAAGYLQGLDVGDELTARLRPDPPNCCVVLERSA